MDQGANVFHWFFPSFGQARNPRIDLERSRMGQLSCRGHHLFTQIKEIHHHLHHMASWIVEESANVFLISLPGFIPDTSGTATVKSSQGGLVKESVPQKPEQNSNISK